MIETFLFTVFVFRLQFSWWRHLIIKIPSAPSTCFCSQKLESVPPRGRGNIHGSSGLWLMIEEHCSTSFWFRDITQSTLCPSHAFWRNVKTPKISAYFLGRPGVQWACFAPTWPTLADPKKWCLLLLKGHFVRVCKTPVPCALNLLRHYHSGQ